MKRRLYRLLFPTTWSCLVRRFLQKTHMFELCKLKTLGPTRQNGARFLCLYLELDLLM